MEVEVEVVAVRGDEDISGMLGSMAEFEGRA
jgi:hypothetical protein